MPEPFTDIGFLLLKAINPASVCNRTGVIIFSFIIIDIYFGPQTFVEELLFLSCSELNCNDNCETCPFGCGECEE